MTMTGEIAPPQPGKINFAGMVGAKRRRMRSGGNVSTLASGNSPKEGSGPEPEEMEDDDEKTAQTSKCKGATTIPIFLKSELLGTCWNTLLRSSYSQLFLVKKGNWRRSAQLGLHSF